MKTLPLNIQKKAELTIVETLMTIFISRLLSISLVLKMIYNKRALHKVRRGGLLMKGKQKGFTIVEAIIALSLFSIFALMSAQTMIHANRYTRDLEDIRLSMAVGNYFMEMFRAVGYQVLYTDDDGIAIDLPNGDLIIPGVWKPIDPEIDEDIYGTILPEDFWVRLNVESFDDPLGSSAEDFKEVVLTILLTTRSGRDFVIQLSSVHVRLQQE